jgi:hypothetical protein
VECQCVEMEELMNRIDQDQQYIAYIVAVEVTHNNSSNYKVQTYQ